MANVFSRGMPHVRMRHVSYTNESRFTIYTVTQHSNILHTRESCLTCEWVMSRMRMSHVLHTNGSRPTTYTNMQHTQPNEFSLTYQWVMSRIRMNHVPQHIYRLQDIQHKSCLTYEFIGNAVFKTPLSPMGWLRLVGSLKFLVSLAEYRLFYRALLQKRPIILRSLLMVATPYLFGRL